MVRAGAGYHITLAHQHGVRSYHLVPFFILLDDLYRPPADMPMTYPWIDFPARYEELPPAIRLPRFRLIPEARTQAPGNIYDGAWPGRSFESRPVSQVWRARMT